MKTVPLSVLSAADRRLVRAAVAVRRRAYAPLSRYACGAALRDDRGRIHVGCNVETIDLTLTTHAEMDAINAMVKSGAFTLKALAVAVRAETGYAFPCGLCRQKISEFAGGDRARILAVSLDARGRIHRVIAATIGELFPHPFTPEHLA